MCDDNLESFNHGAENAGGNSPCLRNHNSSVSGAASNWSDDQPQE